MRSSLEKGQASRLYGGNQVLASGRHGSLWRDIEGEEGAADVGSVSEAIGE